MRVHKWLVHKGEKICAPAICNHAPAGHPGNQSPRRSLALWAVVTNDLCIRRCRAQSNNVTLVNISDEQPPHYFYNIIICFTCNRAVEQATQASTRENLSSGFPIKQVLNQSLRLNRLARNWNFSRSKCRYDLSEKADNKVADETARMGRLVCAFIVTNHRRQVFCSRGPIAINERLENTGNMITQT